ncbi:MAG: HD-GYP domain-containing protein [Nitrospiraceae bacterium]
MGKLQAVRTAPAKGLVKALGVPSVERGPVVARRDATRRRQDDRALAQVMEVLLAAVQMKDRHTYGQSLREAGYAVTLAEEMGLPKQHVENIRRGALLHDVGNLFIGERILHKRDELTEDEFEAVKQHAALGAAVVSKVKGLEDVARIVHHHHERFDGSGYPDGLADDQIPLGARVVAVVDAFGAMTKERPYRKMLTLEEALAELERGAGGQFDPWPLEVFARLARRRATRWPMAHDGNVLLAEVLIDDALA